MPDNLSPADRLKTMRAVKGRGTRLEKRLFAMLAGMRVAGWRQNANDLVGKPDAAFDEAKVALFVDGCFWHGCPHCQRPLPVTNIDYWTRKISRNIERDQANTHALEATGWTVLRAWEHEMRDATLRKQLRAKIRAALDAASAG